MHDITREQADVGRAKMNELGDWDDILTHDTKALVGSLLDTKDGGYKRKKKRKRRKPKKRKTRRRKRKTRRRKTRRRKKPRKK